MRPIQNLNGYDYPWAGGAEKNKANPTGASGTQDGITYVKNSDGSFTVTGTNTKPVYASVYLLAEVNVINGETYILNGCPADGSNNSYRLDVRSDPQTVYASSDTGSGLTFQSDFTGTLYVYARFAGGYAISGSLIFYPMIRLASEADDTFVPYENICPISGWVGAEVTRTGKNLLQNNLVDGTVNDVTFTKNANGSISLSGTSTANTVRPINVDAPLLLKKGVEYILTGGVADVASLQIRKFSDSSAIVQGYTVNYTPDEDVEVLIRISINNGKVTDGIVVSPMVRLASDSDATYEPYNGDVYPISWQTEAGTVYGGTIDFTSGVLTVTEQSYSVDGSRTPTGINTSSVPNYTIFYDYLNGAKVWPGLNGEVKCDSLKYETASTVFSTAQSSFSSTSSYQNSPIFKMPTSLIGSDAASITTYLQAHPMQIVAPLETPATYQLTPQQITTLLGVNNIWVETIPD